MIQQKINLIVKELDHIKKFCKDLKEHAAKIINYEKRKMIPLADEELKSYEKQIVCYICKKEFSTDDDNKKYQKVRDHCHYTEKYRGATHDLCNLRYKMSKEIPAVFHNSSTYNYHPIIKELVKEFEGEFECIGRNTEKLLLFQYQLKKSSIMAKQLCTS